MWKAAFAFVVGALVLLVLNGPAAAGSANGSAGDMPAFYDGQLFTINFKEEPSSAEQSLLAHNGSINTIYMCDSCAGKTAGGGFPIPGDFHVDDDHVFGLVALELQAVARRGVRPDASATPERDLRTARFTRWLHYPVRFVSLASTGPVEKDLRRALG